MNANLHASTAALRRVILISLALLCPSLALCQVPAEQERSVRGLTALSSPVRSEAYARFIANYVIATPHPDKTIQGFIDRAKDGEPGAFAFIAFMVWLGYAGIHQDQVAGKFGLIRAMGDGSGVAAGFIGQTFAISPGNTEKDKVDSYLAALHWYGVAVGMGEPNVHETAMKLIDSLGSGSQKQRDDLMKLYNKGMEEGVRNKGK